jgi:hypothetical protein
LEPSDPVCDIVRRAAWSAEWAAAVAAMVASNWYGANPYLARSALMSSASSRARFSFSVPAGDGNWSREAVSPGSAALMMGPSAAWTSVAAATSPDTKTVAATVSGEMRT